MLDFLDLGCGSGGSINWGKRFGGKTHLGIGDRVDELSKAVQDGYFVMCADITKVEFPKVRYVTMLHVLEHLKDKNAVKKVIKKSIEAANEFVFIKGPTFENYDYLKSLGFKITWTDWFGHPTFVTADLLEWCLKDSGLSWVYGFQYPIPDSTSTEIIPYTAPTDTIIYNGSLGEKPYTEFENVYREIYCFININCLDWERIIRTDVL